VLVSNLSAGQHSPQQKTRNMAGDAPFVITATDKSGSIAIAATLFMSWMVIVCLIRLYMRLTMNGPLGIDDWAAFSAGVSQAPKSNLRQTKTDEKH
jgi:hypothetical protein